MIQATDSLHSPRLPLSSSSILLRSSSGLENCFELRCILWKYCRVHALPALPANGSVCSQPAAPFSRVGHLRAAEADRRLLLLFLSLRIRRKLLNSSLLVTLRPGQRRDVWEAGGVRRDGGRGSWESLLCSCGASDVGRGHFCPISKFC